MADFIRVFPTERRVGNTSVEFEIESSVALVQIKGFAEGDMAVVEYYFGDDCEGSWEPFSICNRDCDGEDGIVSIRYPITNFMLNIPNKYRLVLMDRDGNYVNNPLLFEDVEIIVKKLECNACVS